MKNCENGMNNKQPMFVDTSYWDKKLSGQNGQELKEIMRIICYDNAKFVSKTSVMRSKLNHRLNTHTL